MRNFVDYKWAFISRKGEVKILDYQTQQHRLFPMLARSFAFIFTGVETRKLYYRVLQELDKGKVG